MNQKNTFVNDLVNASDNRECEKKFTTKQGQYLAFIHAYTLINRRAPAETDMQRYFQVTPPSVHQMVLMLEREGLIHRQPRTARSIVLLIDPEKLPVLKQDHINPS
jgi:DNA-binding MarR family transcriptional regulator